MSGIIGATFNLLSKGDRFDSRLHEIDGAPLAMGSNRSGTVAIVLQRGVKTSDDKKVLSKAKERVFS